MVLLVLSVFIQNIFSLCLKKISGAGHKRGKKAFPRPEGLDLSGCDLPFRNKPVLQTHFLLDGPPPFLYISFDRKTYLLGIGYP